MAVNTYSEPSDWTAIPSAAYSVTSAYKKGFLFPVEIAAIIMASLRGHFRRSSSVHHPWVRDYVWRPDKTTSGLIIEPGWRVEGDESNLSPENTAGSQKRPAIYVSPSQAATQYDETLDTDLMDFTVAGVSQDTSQDWVYVNGGVNVVTRAEQFEVAEGLLEESDMFLKLFSRSIKVDCGLIALRCHGIKHAAYDSKLKEHSGILDMVYSLRYIWNIGEMNVFV